MESPWPKTLIRVVSILSMLTLVLYVSANNFDESEIKVITWMGGFLGVGETANILFGKKS